jgi:DNA topoisomerase I
LIWQRFVASQMEAAVYDTLTVEVNAPGKQHRYLLRTSGSVLRFPGFLVVYEETRDEDQAPRRWRKRAHPGQIVEGQRRNWSG